MKSVHQFYLIILFCSRCQTPKKFCFLNCLFLFTRRFLVIVVIFDQLSFYTLLTYLFIFLNDFHQKGHSTLNANWTLEFNQALNLLNAQLKRVLQTGRLTKKVDELRQLREAVHKAISCEAEGYFLNIFIIYIFIFFAAHNFIIVLLLLAATLLARKFDADALVDFSFIESALLSLSLNFQVFFCLFDLFFCYPAGNSRFFVTFCFILFYLKDVIKSVIDDVFELVDDVANEVKEKN